MNWRTVIQTFECPTCNAQRGEPCTTAGGAKRYEPHAARGYDADRCPQCHSRLAALALPGDLCERCMLVRSLETERSTVYRRLT